ncbi:MAG: LysR family transcriptional regulator [Propionibacteriales bacterium]|nr:LysR family transcriptional regulator [Propionibacteriales bacterium]
MNTDRLAVLLELSRHGSMRAVADVLMTSTSTVSQQVAALSREVGTPLVEPDGRGVRLTPAGRRLADHAVAILAAVEAARADLDPDAEPAGTVRVAGFATAIRTTLLPAVAELAVTHPAVHVVVHELEPGEAREALLADRIDLALAYDYDLAPVTLDRAVESVPLWRSPWGLGVPTAEAPTTDLAAPDLLRRHAAGAWIGNSRNTADEEVLRVVASMAGFEPRVEHLSDSLDLVEDLVVAGLGVGMLPLWRRPRDGVTVVPFHDPGVTMRALLWTRRGRATWPPLALVLERLVEAPSVARQPRVVTR